MSILIKLEGSQYHKDPGTQTGIKNEQMRTYATYICGFASCLVILTVIRTRTKTPKFF